MSTLFNRVLRRLFPSQCQPSDEDRVATQIQERQRQAANLGLANRLLQIHGEMQYALHPEYSGNLARLGVLELKIEKAEDKTKIVEFTKSSHRYMLSLSERWCSNDDDAHGWHFGTLMLRDGSGHDLFLVHTSRGEFGDPQPGEVEAFAPGEWVSDILELSDSVTALRDERANERKRVELEEKKKRFGLT